MNKSGETVSRMVVVVCNKTHVHEGLQPNETWSFVFEIGADSHYEVTAVMESGRKSRISTGYVAPLLEKEDVFHVTPEEVVFVESRQTDQP